MMVNRSLSSLASAMHSAQSAFSPYVITFIWTHCSSFYCVTFSLQRIQPTQSTINIYEFNAVWLGTTCAWVKTLFFCVSEFIDQRYDPIISGSCIASPNFSIIIPTAYAIAHSAFIRCRMDDAHHARFTFHSFATFFSFHFPETLRRSSSNNPWSCKTRNRKSHTSHAVYGVCFVHRYAAVAPCCCSLLIAQVSFSHLSFCQIRYQRIGAHRDRCRQCQTNMWWMSVCACRKIVSN